MANAPDLDRETIRAPRKKKWSQGDVLRFSRGSLNHPIFGFVINADCDLEHKKTEGVISYLPVFSLVDYLSLFWEPRFLAHSRKSFLNQLATLLSLDRDEQTELELLTHEQNFMSIIKKMTIFAKLKHTQEQKINELACKILTSLEDSTSLSTIHKLAQKTNNPSKELMKYLKDGYKSIGDSNFFVNEIVDNENLGFVIKLNRIESIDENFCFRSESDFLANDNTETSAIRVGSFTDVFRFRIVQLFAQQFSRIGLDDFFYSAQDIAIAELAQSLNREQL